MDRVDDYETIVENESEVYNKTVDQGGQSTVKDNSHETNRTKSQERRSLGLDEGCSQDQNGNEFDYLADGDATFAHQLSLLQRTSISSKHTQQRSGTEQHRCSHKEKRMPTIQEEGSKLVPHGQALTDSIQGDERSLHNELKERLDTVSYPQYNTSAAVSSQHTPLLTPAAATTTMSHAREERGHLSLNDRIKEPRRTMRMLKPNFPPLVSHQSTFSNQRLLTSLCL